jgi:5-methylcytosine-specific restriction endonuclease McrA
MTQVMQQPIFVLAQSGKPLMPTYRHNKVWDWLRNGLATVVNREPFTIQLQFETKTYTQAVTVGVDTGSQTVGIVTTTNGKVAYQAEVHLRHDITGKLTQRRQYRRNRRSRKTRYRAARFTHRRRPCGWLPPSIRSKAEATTKAVRQASHLLPISRVHVEVASFDTQKLRHPEIAGIAYQHGQLHGYLLREYVVAKWRWRCGYCGKNGLPLQLEHIIPKSRGGSDRVDNLALACEACNTRKGKRTAGEFGFPHIQDQARVPLRDAAHIGSLKTEVVRHLVEQFGKECVTITFGYETKYQRIQVLDLPKSHTNDAMAIACERGEVVKPLAVVYHVLCIPRGNYQLFNGQHSEHRVWAPGKVRGWKLYELVRAKEQIGYIGGRRLKGSFVIKDLATNKKLLEVAPSKLIRVARATHGWLIISFVSPRIAAKEGGASPSA